MSKNLTEAIESWFDCWNTDEEKVDDNRMSRELDGAIAEALGIKSCDKWRCVHFSRGDYIKECDCEKCLPSQYWPPRYSKNGNDMLELDKEMQEREWSLEVTRTPGGCRLKNTAATYYKLNDDGDYVVILESHYVENMTLAVALAAYHALTGKEWQE